MAAGGALCRRTDSSQDNEDMSSGEAGTLHERLVAYVHALTDGSRRGVWGEHSYARGRSAARDSPRVRVLLAPRAPSPPRALLDVETPPAPPASPPAPPAPPPDPPADDEDEWEARAAAAAPGAPHARLLDAALDALRAMRLERLVAPGGAARREQARAAARRLRRALAPHWAAGGAPAWLHATLAAHLPRAPRRLYEEALGELRRAAPRLAERLTGAWAPPPAAPAPPGRARGAAASPWLVWVASGAAALDARWERRLAALVHTRVVRGAAGAPGAPPAPPEPWCAAAAGAVRAALTDALAEAGSRSVVLGGLGAGAAAALVVARGAGGPGAAGGVRGLLLVAPPLLTAEGARDARDDTLRACRLPLLLVAGSHAADAPAYVANTVAESGAARRLLEVRGADSELRLPRRLRERHRLPQEALDAALVEECARWAVETAEQEERAGSPPPAPRRAPLAAVLRDVDLTAEEYSHLPAEAPPAPSLPNVRVVEKLEGRVVSRGSGGTPLALLPPRRAGGGGGGGAALAAADIMQLPIVFADDAAPVPAAPAAPAAPPAPAAPAAPPAPPAPLHAAEASASGSPVTVTSGTSKRAGGTEGAGPVKFTRVILAKRGAGAGRGAAPRRLLLRRGVRLVPRDK